MNCDQTSDHAHDGAQPSRRLIPVTRWEQEHGWPTEAALRYYIFNAADNGFFGTALNTGLNLFNYLVNGQAAGRTACHGRQAIGAAVIATVLSFDKGPCPHADAGYWS